MSNDEFSRIESAFNTHAVICFREQFLDEEQLIAFARRFGEVERIFLTHYAHPRHAEIMYVSNIKENGRDIGHADAGRVWHTDMSYNRTIGFLNVLYAVKVPMRDAKPLGATLFANMHAAYEGLDPELKQLLKDKTATHDFNKFWEKMRLRPGSIRGPLTAEQRAKRPPSVHPVVLTHPISGRPVLYCNPGYAIRINELDERESEEVLERLFAHQLRPEYQYTHTWSVGDVLVWDHVGTLHNAVPDYGPHEQRLMKRCQVMANRIFDPAFLHDAYAAGSAH